MFFVLLDKLYSIYKNVNNLFGVYIHHYAFLLTVNITIKINIPQASSIFNIGVYTSPFIVMYMYKRGFFALDECRTLARFFGGVGCLIAISFLIRGIGRAYSPKYTQFLNALMNSYSDQKIFLETIRKYDFEFYAWPVSYTVSPKKR